jgi:alanyl-tRNA synthetase
MTSTDPTGRFIEFFGDRGHRLIDGVSLVPPDGDPVLFTTSGMHPLTPYLLGRPHPLGRRLTGLQRCLRTTDLDEVGDETHLTVFQMLGSWSLGDYEGPQSLRWGSNCWSTASASAPTGCTRRSSAATAKSSLTPSRSAPGRTLAYRSR